MIAMFLLLAVWGLGVSMAVTRLRKKNTCPHHVLIVSYRNYRNKEIRGACKDCGKWVNTQENSDDRAS